LHNTSYLCLINFKYGLSEDLLLPKFTNQIIHISILEQLLMVVHKSISLSKVNNTIENSKKLRTTAVTVAQLPVLKQKRKLL